MRLLFNKYGQVLGKQLPRKVDNISNFIELTSNFSKPLLNKVKVLLYIVLNNEKKIKQ